VPTTVCDSDDRNIAIISPTSTSMIWRRDMRGASGSAVERDR
jgi:hypothetical protein